MEDKNYKGLIWLVVILIILVVAMMGFIVYKELNDEEKPCNINTTNTTTKEEDKKLIKDVKDFPKKSDENVLLSITLIDLLDDSEGNSLVNFEENFQNVKYQINNIKYTLSCEQFGESYSDSGVNACTLANIKFDEYNTYLLVHAGPIIITKDYIISQSIDSGMPGAIVVYDKKGNEVFSEGNSVWRYSIYDDETEDAESLDYEVKIAVVDNVLYYVSYDDDSTNLYFNSFDLSNLKKTQIQEFEGTAWGMVD